MKWRNSLIIQNECKMTHEHLKYVYLRLHISLTFSSKLIVNTNYTFFTLGKIHISNINSKSIQYDNVTMFNNM